MKIKEVGERGVVVEPIAQKMPKLRKVWARRGQFQAISNEGPSPLFVSEWVASDLRMLEALDLK